MFGIQNVPLLIQREASSLALCGHSAVPSGDSALPSEPQVGLWCRQQPLKHLLRLARECWYLAAHP
jgi:hypothetical protein